MSSYDDPRWYEEPEQNNASSPAQRSATYNDFNTLPRPDGSHNGTFTPGKVTRQQTYHVSGSGQRRSWALAQTILTIMLMALAFLGGWFAHQNFSGVFFSSNQSQSYANLIQQAWTDVDQNYVDRKAVNYQQMSYQAIRAMLAVLNDKGHTRFLTASDVQSENQDLSGTIAGGIGITLPSEQIPKQFTILSVIPGSPAEKAGLKPGDIIVAVNGVSTAGKDSTTVHSLIDGKVGTRVTLTLQRPSTQQTLTKTLIRANITIPNVILHYIAEDHIADIQIIQFAQGVSDQLKAALNTAQNMGATSLILDLRDDPGGYLQEAINTASEFIAKGNVLLEQDSKGNRTPYAVTGDTVNTTIPMVVLVNNNTASAAEIVSGALQDNNRALIIGVKTYGTGTVLQEFDLADGSAILLGTQEWLTPKGHFIRDLGINPNIEVVLSAKVTPLTPGDENVEHLPEQQILKSGDTQVVAAIHYLDAHVKTSTMPSQGNTMPFNLAAASGLAFEPALLPVMS